MDHDGSSAPPSTGRRAAWIALLTLACLLIGFGVGTTVGAMFFVPPGSGLAGPTIALGYGVVGVILASAVAAVLATMLPARWLRTSALAGLGVAIAIAGAVAYRTAAIRAELRTRAGLDVPRPPPSDLLIEAWMSQMEVTRAYRELEVSGETWEVKWSAVGPGAASCTAEMTAAEANAVETRLRDVDSRLGRTPPPCEGVDESATIRFLWRRGTTAPRTIEGGATCLAAEAEWAALATTLARIPIDAVSTGRANCG